LATTYDLRDPYEAINYIPQERGFNTRRECWYWRIQKEETLLFHIHQLKMMTKCSTRMGLLTSIIAVNLGVLFAVFLFSITNWSFIVGNLQDQLGSEKQTNFIPFKYEDINMLLMTSFYDLRPLKINQKAALRIVALTNIRSDSTFYGKMGCKWIDEYGNTQIVFEVKGFQTIDDGFHNKP
jgi:hypothetical protein